MCRLHLFLYKSHQNKQMVVKVSKRKSFKTKAELQDSQARQILIDYANADIQYRSQPKQDENQTDLQEVPHDNKSSQQLRAKSIKLIRNDHTPTTAASSNKREDLQTADLIDAHSGKPIQPRKKVQGRIDQFLESRGSIFSGRDEAQVLHMKRQQEQREIQEALKQQIEDKRQRQQQEKEKQDHFDDQWNHQTPKTNRIKLESQGEQSNISFGMMSPSTFSQFSLYNQIPQSSHGIQFQAQTQQKQRRGDVQLDILEEEKSSDITAAQLLSPSIINSGQKSPIENQVNTEIKKQLKITQFQSELPRSSSHKIIGVNPKFASNITARNQNVKQLIKQIQLKTNQTGNDTQPHEQKLTNHGNAIMPQLQHAKFESQQQIDALSTMVEQLLTEQQHLKSKIFQQEKILEDHLQTREGDGTDRASQRNSSREFKIRKSKVVSLSRQASEEQKIELKSPEEEDEDTVQNNLILNHQVSLKNQNASFKATVENQNTRYNNRQSNKMQFIERNEKIKQQNHLIKFGPSKSNPRIQKDNHQEINNEAENQIDLKLANLNQFTDQDSNQEKLAVAKSIDALNRNSLYNQQMKFLQKETKYNSQSQENFKFSQSVKNLNIQNQMTQDQKFALTQNLDFQGKSQLLYFSENQQKSGTNFLPEIKVNQPNTQGMMRTSSDSVLKKIENGTFRDPNVNSNYQHYESNNAVKSKQSKQIKSRQDELDMISSIMMPESIIMNSHDQNQIKPLPTLQNNLISSQKFLQGENQSSQNLQTFYSNAHILHQQQLEQIDEYVPKSTVNQAKPKILRKKSSRLSIIKDVNQQNQQQIMRLSQRKFFKVNQQQPGATGGPTQQEINLADRLTFSNFYKDQSGNANFEPIQFDLQQQQPNKRLSPSPVAAAVGATHAVNSVRQSMNPPIMVIKKNQNRQLAPLQLKKITPVKKKFPHDFFSGNQNEGDE